MEQEKLFMDVALARAFEGTVCRAMEISGTALDPIRQEWNSALAEYFAAEALASADALFGAYWKAGACHDDLTAEIEAEFGRAWRSVPEAKARADAAFDVYEAALAKREAEFLIPLWAAEKRLSETPAPDMQAVAFKIEFIRRHKLMQDVTFTARAFELIREDLARLQGRPEKPTNLTPLSEPGW